MNYYPEQFPEDGLKTVIGFFRKDPDCPLELAIEGSYAVIGYALKMFVGNGNVQKQKLWLTQPVKYEWPDLKYAARLEDVFRFGDSKSTAFPWYLVLEISLNVNRTLLARVK